MGYNKDVDYQEKINDAVKNNDYQSAAEYEKSRNEKIDAENLPYEKTNRFSGWLDKTDYSVELKNQMNSGASKSKVSQTLKNRVNKASGTEGLSHYAYDDVYDAAIAYIMREPDFNYEVKMPEYQNKYGDKIMELYEKLSDIEPFSYNAYSDDLYKYYKEQYNREGKRAMEDLLGELATNTGGVASSYAVSAASQMLENYNKKLTDIIPELYESAYERYLDSINIERNNLGLLKELSDSEYDKYLNDLAQYNKDREFSYENYIDSLEREFRMQEYETEKEYNSEKLNAENEENERKWNQKEYENEQKRKQQEIETALDKWDALGYLDAESARILGLPEGLHTSDYDYKRAQEHRLYSR